MTNQHTGYSTDRQPASGLAGTVKETAQNAAQSAADAVKGAADRAKRGAGEAYETASDWAGEQYGQARRWASESYDEYERRTRRTVRGARSQAETFVSENPVLVGVIGLATGLLLGSLLPRTRPEDRAFGHWADEVRDQGFRYARKATQRGREYVEETIQDVARNMEAPQERRQAPPPNRSAPSGEREGPSGRFQNI